MDCGLPGCFVHGILQARILEWVAIPFSRGSSQPRDGTQVSHIAGRFFIILAVQFSSVTQSCLSLRPHESQHARPPCPSPTVAPSAPCAWNLSLICVFSSPTILLFKNFFCFLGHLLFFLLFLSCLLTSLICRVHHEKRWAGRRTSWNQDCQEKFQ